MPMQPTHTYIWIHGDENVYMVHMYTLYVYTVIVDLSAQKELLEFMPHVKQHIWGQHSFAICDQRSTACLSGH